MRLSELINLQESQNELRVALERTVGYAKDTQKGELSLRDAINYLAGSVKNIDKNIYDLLDELLKNTK